MNAYKKLFTLILLNERIVKINLLYLFIVGKPVSNKKKANNE